jgi:peptidoglycan-associated lipoprotein
MQFSMRIPLLFIAAAVALGGCNSAMQAYKKGVRHYEAGEYNLALGQFEKASKGPIDAGRLNYYTAESYRLSNRIGQAAPFYQKALDAGAGLPGPVNADLPNGATPAKTGPNDPDLRLNYAYALKANGDYAGAQTQLQHYLDSRPKNKVGLARAERELGTLRAIGAISAKQTDFRLTNLGGLNSAGTEYAPVLRGEELVFTASRKDVIYKNNGLAMTGLYKAKVGQTPDETGAGGPQPFSGAVFQNDANEGTPTFSKDGKIMVFARGNTGKRKGGLDVDLYMSRLQEGNNWGIPFRLPISDSLAWDGSPAFSADGKTLYFASNRAGSVGGIDLYRANMDASGRFGRPVNMGRDINTPGDEMFPFVAADGKLYFSSDGHPGLGKLDVFVATRSQGVIRIENMGVPINSPADDFGLTFPEPNRGYMASNRPGGKGDDDIYLVEQGAAPDPTKPKTPGSDSTTIVQNGPKRVRYFLAGTVSAIGTPATPLDSARVRIVEDATEATVAETTTEKPGTFGKFPIQEGKTYSVIAERKGYLTKREPFTMQGRSIPEIFLTKPETDTTFSVALALDKVELDKTFVLENIYYDLNKFNIRSDAAEELDKLVTILKDNPTLKIELSSHTDARDTDSYNLKLSQNRAKSAVDYIISKGIDADRLSARGYGETKLIVKQARTEEEHQRNRRTEFKVLAL